jgi:hypothetical protein
MGSFAAYQAQVGFMHQGRGLKRLARLFIGEFLGRQPAQLLVHERQQLGSVTQVAQLHGCENSRYFSHGDTTGGSTAR